MFGNNPKRPILKGDGNNLEVQEIFLTIQGEGPYAGHSALFIRLGGCNLACKFCDTEFESFKYMLLSDILKKVTLLNNNNTKLIVITGGEPFRQPIELLCLELIKLGYKVQIETNGTLYRELPKEVDIVCSPKSSQTGYSNIREDLLTRINALKFIISSSNPKYQMVQEIGQSKFNIPVYIQPMDEYDPVKNKENLEYSLKLIAQNGYRLSLQMHKIIGVS